MSSSLPLNLRISLASSSAYGGSPGVARLLGSPSLNPKLKATFTDAAAANDAVLLSLKKRQRPDVEAAANADAPAGAQSSGEALGMLKRLSEIVTRLKDLKGEIDKGTLLGEARKALEEEVGGLTSEFSSILASDSFKRLSEFLQGITGTLGSGGDAEALAKSLKQQRGLFGDNLLGLVQRAELYRLSQFSGSLSGLGELDPSSVLADDSLLNNASGFLNAALKALSAPGYEEHDEQTASVDAAVKTIEAPRQQDLLFQGAGKIALTLRSYPPEELLKAAMNGLDIDAAGLLILTIPKEKDEAKALRQELEQHDALRHVENFNQTLPAESEQAAAPSSAEDQSDGSPAKA